MTAMPDRALILVDIQNDFVPGGALAARGLTPARTGAAADAAWSNRHE